MHEKISAKNYQIQQPSLGVAARVPGDNDSKDDLVKDADDALYRVQRAGRNRVSW
ncbi:MAG: GGDEF domain-containing protein [Candidatus Competibacteraceae bacterium]